jgi:glycosyltransferase involved in cell wall biosynthesis
MVSPKGRLKPGISVILCCHNSSRVIVPTVGALSHQMLSEPLSYEVILVDNNCTDDTVQLAQNTWSSGESPIRVAKESKPGLAFARSKGLSLARYDIVQFVDDDNILCPDWLSRVFSLYRQVPSAGVIGGLNRALIEGTRPRWFDAYQHIYACGPRADRSGLITKKVFGAGLSFRTEVLQEVMDPACPLFLTGRTRGALLRGDDTELVLRAFLRGWKCLYDSALRLDHALLASRLTWNYVCSAVRGGGRASLILGIYQSLLNESHPPTYAELMRRVFAEWYHFIDPSADRLNEIREEGSRASFQFNWLRGKTMGLLSYARSYGKIRKRILGHYPMPKH